MKVCRDVPQSTGGRYQFDWEFEGQHHAGHVRGGTEQTAARPRLSVSWAPRVEEYKPLSTASSVGGAEPPAAQKPAADTAWNRDQAYPYAVANITSDSGKYSAKQDVQHARSDMVEPRQLTIEELRVRLQARDATVADMRDEIAMLKTSAEAFRERFAQIEAESLALQHVPAGSILLVKPEELTGVAKEVWKGQSEHAKAVAHNKFIREDNLHYEPETADLSAVNLAMGRDYMSLDRRHQESQRLEAELAANKRRVIEDIRYAGHMAAPVEQLMPTWTSASVGGGSRFWLDDTNGACTRGASSLEGVGCRRDKSGCGEDALPIDWLGRAKRGLPYEKSMASHTTGAPPRWMY
eukprot:TRINITY_DN8831_c0_g1_i1.p1 TRINITY_DN8831_c0_g1~~TRINITY_DN8831_c0_g1_i1.p1  ORF type:complete len:373 (+),score=47.56 TRINITY_DN8831_c0_g1_i1:64-1119(+)